MRISIFLSYPKRPNPREFDPQVYRARNLVKRFFNRIEHSQRIAMRYDKLRVLPRVRDEGLGLDLFGLNVNII